MGVSANAGNAELEELAIAYLDVLNGLLSDVAAHWARVREASDVATARADTDALTHLAHRIAGSAGSFGYTAASNAASTLEHVLRGFGDHWPDDVPALVDDLACPMAELLAVPRSADLSLFAPTPRTAPVSSPRSDADERKPLYIVDGDTEQAERTAAQVVPFGYRTRLFSCVDDALAAVGAEAPCAIVAELEFSDGSMAGARLASRLAGAIPVIVMTDRTDFAARLAVARCGCAAHLVKPVETLDLVNWIDELTGLRPGDAHRVLILDDDRSLAEYHGAILSAAGMQVRVLSEPTDLLPALEDFAPDLILMDMYMPGCTGIELARVVRQHRKYLGMPIVFLSVESDLTRQFAALSPGADDFLTKPIQPDHLVQAVRVRAMRARDLRSVMETDSLTGLLNHAHLKERLQYEQSRAARLGAPLTFALIDLDHFKKVNDRQGHLAGDRVIRSLARLLSSRLRRTDIIGRYGGEEFGIVLPDTTEAEATAVLDDIRVVYSRIVHVGNDGEFQVTLSGGLAAFQPAKSGEAHILDADAALYRAKSEGRNRLVTFCPPSAEAALLEACSGDA